VFPFHGSAIRRLASLHRLRAGYRSPASSVLSRRSDFLPPIPRRFVSSLRGTTHLCAWPGSGELLFAGSSSVLRRCLNPLPAIRSRGDGWISQVPWQPLLANMPCSSTPADRGHQATHDAFDVAFRALHDVGSAFRPLSRPESHGLFARCLRFAARITPTNTTQDSLPADGHSWRDRIFTCQVASGGLHSAIQLTSFPPPQGFPGARSAGPTDGRVSPAAKS
jgi:hypothetical protein